MSLRDVDSPARAPQAAARARRVRPRLPDPDHPAHRDLRPGPAGVRLQRHHERGSRRERASRSSTRRPATHRERSRSTRRRRSASKRGRRDRRLPDVDDCVGRASTPTSSSCVALVKVHYDWQPSHRSSATSSDRSRSPPISADADRADLPMTSGPPVDPTARSPHDDPVTPARAGQALVDHGHRHPRDRRRHGPDHRRRQRLGPAADHPGRQRRRRRGRRHRPRRIDAGQPAPAGGWDAEVDARGPRRPPRTTASRSRSPTTRTSAARCCGRTARRRLEGRCGRRRRRAPCRPTTTPTRTARAASSVRWPASRASATRVRLLRVARHRDRHAERRHDRHRGHRPSPGTCGAAPGCIVLPVTAPVTVVTCDGTGEAELHCRPSGRMNAGHRPAVQEQPRQRRLARLDAEGRRRVELEQFDPPSEQPADRSAVVAVRHCDRRRQLEEDR